MSFGSSSVDIQADPRIRQGKEFLKEKKYEEAIGLFSSVVQSCVEAYGEMAVETAKAFFEYGNALLIQEEDNPKRNILSNVEDDEAKAEEDQDPPGANAPEEKSGEDAESGEGGNDEQEDEEGVEQAEDDLQVAWEVLDVSRCVLMKEPDAERNPILAEVYCRLADLMQLNGNFIGAIPEYEKSLEIKKNICSSDDRSLSGLYYNLATAHIYASGEKDISSPLEEKRKALAYYNQAREVLQLSQQSTTDSVEEKESCNELIDELTESIEALQAEISEETKQGSSGSSSDVAGPVTTIGFGTASSTVNSFSTVATLAVKKRLAAVSPEEQGSNGQSSSLQVKKKAKSEDVNADK